MESGSTDRVRRQGLETVGRDRRSRQGVETDVDRGCRQGYGQGVETTGGDKG